MQTIRELRAQIMDMENEELKLQNIKYELGMITCSLSHAMQYFIDQIST